MNLTEKHIAVIVEYINTNVKYSAWAKYFPSPSVNTEKVQANTFFKRPEVKRMVKKLTEEREAAIAKAVAKNYEKLYSEEIASELELDILHTKIARGQMEMEEIFPVREKKLAPRVKTDRDGNQRTEYVFEETVVFKRVKRQPSLTERQRSARELYMRKGSYKPIKIKNVDPEQDGTEAAEKAKGNDQGIERVILLSDGTKLQMPK